MKTKTVTKSYIKCFNKKIKNLLNKYYIFETFIVIFKLVVSNLPAIEECNNLDP